ncbi:phenylacetate--CoA ligase [Roseospira marina]|uniref:Phenylacetate-coenzyme A ligase n=1 Tax=Roseospira marina TaxID=140057 RepID=A0A5M6IGT1_9PROT|nr:phenylacetate--CoA ligase [Roseospira marina]KAA5607107.1 phenylacetate--CoA ligase [Roseospira marina]MBB4312698.1 phenylacetate-CoA ligase [Roseospira marina]MBB5086529.1 phenylacetate-CoA ligase [Roseospira marina]
MDIAAPQAWMLDPAVESLDRVALATLQWERLRHTLAHAYENVPHVRRAFDAKGVHPEDLRDLSDLRHFPFTVKTDLRDNYPYGLFAVPREQVVRIHASSGTTGKPTVVGYTAGDIDRWAGLMARAMATAGVRPGEVVHNAYGYGLFTGGMGFHYGAERLGCTVVPMSGGNTERQIHAMLDLEASVLCATPSYALNLAEVAERLGIDLRASALRIGLFGAEPWSDGLRHELDERLGIRATDSYGLSEVMGPGVAMECPERCGLHGWEDHFLFEVIDPDTLEPLPMGETGELVITTLTKEALPMIRYRTRDITRLTDEPCACGRTHVRILRVAGRNDDMIILRGVNVYPSQVEAVMLGFPGTAPHYLLTVRREGVMDRLDVQVEAAPDLDVDAYPAVADKVRHRIKSNIGVTCGVTVVPPGTVPRSEGKAVRVKDLRTVMAR